MNMSGAFLVGQAKELKYLLTILGVWLLCKYADGERKKKKMLSELRAQARASMAAAAAAPTAVTSSTTSAGGGGAGAGAITVGSKPSSSSRSSSSSSSSSSSKAKKKSPKSIGEIWQILQPRLPWARATRAARKYAGVGGGALINAGRTEIAAMVVLCLGRTWLMNLYSITVGSLDSTMMTRHQPTFWRWWRVALMLTVVMSVHRTVYKHVENSLATRWQEKLTKIVHSLYFKNIACVISFSRTLPAGMDQPNRAGLTRYRAKTTKRLRTNVHNARRCTLR